MRSAAERAIGIAKRRCATGGRAVCMEREMERPEERGGLKVTTGKRSREREKTLAKARRESRTRRSIGGSSRLQTRAAASELVTCSNQWESALIQAMDLLFSL